MFSHNRDLDVRPLASLSGQDLAVVSVGPRQTLTPKRKKWQSVDLLRQPSA